MSETAVKKKHSPLRFFKEVKAELKKVVWPTPKQTLNNTVVVLIFVAIACVVLALCDLLFTWVVTQVMRLG